MKTIKQYPLLSIFLFSLLWNCIIVFTIPEIHVSSDSDDYLALAKSLSDHGSFMFNNQYETLRTPGYPFFLYIVQKAVGSGKLPAYRIDPRTFIFTDSGYGICHFPEMV